jgi:hypothetical protein
MKAKKTLSQQEAKAAEREYMDLLWSLGSNERSCMTWTEKPILEIGRSRVR